MGRVQPELVIRRELFYEIRHELPPLFVRHWQELSTHQDQVPLDPDWKRYLEMGALGMLHVTTARRGAQLAGYIFNIVGPHLHYATTRCCDIEMFWLEPSERKGWAPIRLFRANERFLDDLGVKVRVASIKLHFENGRVGSIFRRLGYKPIETVYQKVV